MEMGKQIVNKHCDALLPAGNRGLEKMYKHIQKGERKLRRQRRGKEGQEDTMKITKNDYGEGKRKKEKRKEKKENEGEGKEI
jgi:hypothetical protein